MRYQDIPVALFERNRRHLLARLQPETLSIVFANEDIPWSGDQTYPFKQNANFFYLTGINQEDSILALCPHHPNPKFREVLFIKQTNETMVIWYGERLTKEQASAISGIATVLWVDDFEATMRDMAVQSKSIALDLNEAPKFITRFETRDLRMARELRSQYPLHSFERLAPHLMELRMIKQAEEIDLIGKSIEITSKAFIKVLQSLRPGMKEYEVEAEITAEFIRNGAFGHAYYPIIAGGANACILHYIKNDRVLHDGDLLLLDFGADYANYAADCSRTIPVNGKFTSRQKDCYNAVLNVFKHARRLMIPGNTIDHVNKEVNKLMEEEMIRLGLFTAEAVANQAADTPLFFKYYMHGTSHFMGLDVHDVGFKHMPFKKGMVLTCEPGLYIKEEGIGIRIENDILVDDVPVDLMKDLPIEVEEIEELMRRA